MQDSDAVRLQAESEGRTAITVGWDGQARGVLVVADTIKDTSADAIAQLRAGELLSGIGRTIETVAARRGFRIIRNLQSHGVGRALHEAPGSILGYFDRHDTRRLHDGMVITVEPFLATHATRTEDLDDGWSLICPKGYGAQFEHTVVVTRGAPIIVT